MTEEQWDKKLRIHTTGRLDGHADQYHYPYEPTPYTVLERLAESGYIKGENILIDYGCGKGRVGFFLAHRTKVAAIGIEYDARIYQEALKNRQTAKAKADFILAKAEACAVPETVNRCYFFNPFSQEILHKVMARILESYYAQPREILLFFYYPSDEYIAYLMTVAELEFYDEISCEDLFPGNNSRERILIFSLPDYGP